MAKFIDPSSQNKNKNLSIFYIIEEFFDQTDQLALNDIVQDMMVIRDSIRRARHKLLAHFDIKTILDSQTIGDFTEVECAAYFNSLKLFVETINLRLLNQPLNYSPSCSGDVLDFLKIYQVGLKSQINRQY